MKMKKFTRKIKKKMNKTNKKITDLGVEKLKNMRDEAKKLTDPRIKKKCTYKIWDIVCVVIIATIANCNEWEEIYDFAIEHRKWLRSFLLLTGGIPTAKTYENVMTIIEPNELQKLCHYIYEELIIQTKKEKDFYHFDGKVDKGSKRRRDKNDKKIKPLNVLNVYSECAGMCIDQEMIEDKTNEIPAIPKIIERLELKGVICTWDALNTQTDTVKAVIDKKGDYVGALKGNQGNFYKDVQDYFDEDRLLIIESGYEGAYKKEIEKSHSQIITYEYYQTEKVKWYEEHEKWEKLKSIGVVVKTMVGIDGKKAIEKRYYISSLLLDIELFSEAIRKHWSVENKLHWQMDFTFKCDNNTTSNKKALFNLQIIKKNALNILNMVKGDYGKCSLKRIRFKVGMNPEREIPKIFYLVREKMANL